MAKSDIRWRYCAETQRASTVSQTVREPETADVLELEWARRMGKR